MKKILAIILAAIMCMVVFTACGGDNNTDDLADKAGTGTGNAAQTTEGTGTAAGTDKVDDAESDWAYIQNKGKMIVGITYYAPMNYEDENGELTGFDTEFTKKVAEKLGVEVEFLVLGDWGAKIQELDSKAIDCVWNGMTLTDEVLNGMNCTNPYIVNAQVVVMAADKAADYTTVESLKDLTFACESGSAGESALKDNELNYNALETQADALLEVKSGAADACVIDVTMAESMTGEGTDFASLGVGMTLTTEEYGIGFRKGSDVTEKVNAIMTELAAEGFIQDIAEKYELADKLADDLKSAAAAGTTAAA